MKIKFERKYGYYKKEYEKINIKNIQQCIHQVSVRG